MEKCTNGQDVPVGLGIALEKNNGMDFFFSLSANEQQQIINQAYSIQSKDEMLAYVQSIMENNSLA